MGHTTHSATVAQRKRVRGRLANTLTDLAVGSSALMALLRKPCVASWIRARLLRIPSVLERACSHLCEDDRKSCRGRRSWQRKGAFARARTPLCGSGTVALVACSSGGVDLPKCVQILQKQKHFQSQPTFIHMACAPLTRSLPAR